MTNEEAIKWCRNFQDNIITDIEKLEDKHKMALKAIGKAIEALEKQIPKKPNKDLCPMCSAVVNIDESYITYSMNYSVEYQAGFCPSCGQKIDWSKDD